MLFSLYIDVIGLPPSTRKQCFHPLCLAGCGKSDRPKLWDGFFRLKQPHRDAIEAAYDMNEVYIVVPDRTDEEILAAILENAGINAAAER